MIRKLTEKISRVRIWKNGLIWGRKRRKMSIALSMFTDEDFGY